MGNVYEVLSHQKISRAPAFFNERLVIEDCENIHVHFRNMRLEFTTDEFIKFAQAMQQALNRIKPLEVKWVPIDDINPWDNTHRLDSDGEYVFHERPLGHLAQIETIKKAIQAGSAIRPILVKPVENEAYHYQRYDGFCRWAAYRELGLQKIECIIDRRCAPGGQEGRPSILTNSEYEVILKGRTY